MTVDDWRDRAACRGRTHQFFQPVDLDGRTTPNSGWTLLAAQRICAACPVARQCIDFATEGREVGGIWAGAGGNTLRGIRRVYVASEAAHDPDNPGCPCDYCALVDDHLSRLRALRDPTVKRMPKAPPRVTANQTHGAASTYNRGCRCEPCRWSRSKTAVALRKTGIDLPAWIATVFGDAPFDRPTADTQATRTLKEHIMRTPTAALLAAAVTTNKNDVRDVLLKATTQSVRATLPDDATLDQLLDALTTAAAEAFPPDVLRAAADLIDPPEKAA